MWYENLVNRKIDGLRPLLSLFEHEDGFVDHFIENVKFFDPAVVEILSVRMLGSISNNEKIPVRYSMKTREYFRYDNSKVERNYSVKSFKNKSDAQTFAEKEDYYHKDTNVKVCIDKDGNYYVRRAIYEAAGLKVSQGATSDMHNYVISHIWANTENPYFFTSLWNVTLIPNYLSFILDKPDENSEIVRKIKLLCKALCYRLYNPNELVRKLVVDEKELEPFFLKADEYISKGKITFLKSSELADIDKKLEVEDPYDMWEELRAIDKNKEFILLALEKLRPTNLDFVTLFQDKGKCREICKMSYPILVDITGLNDDKVREKMRPVRSNMYYASSYFEINSRQYLISNDWYPENREMLLEWLTGFQN